MSTKVIGITGGIGAGKSVVLDYIQKNYKALVLKTDEVAHDVMNPGTDCNRKLQEIFPPSVFAQDGSIIKEEMAKAMYDDGGLLEKVNAIVHPAVGDYLRQTVAKERSKNELDYVIIESALYDGSGFALLCDTVWNVDASREVRMERLMKDRGYSKEKVLSIFESQKRYDEQRGTLSVQIKNNADLEQTLRQVDDALAKL